MRRSALAHRNGQKRSNDEFSERDRQRAALMICSWVNSASPSSANSVPMPDCFGNVAHDGGLDEIAGPVHGCAAGDEALR